VGHHTSPPTWLWFSPNQTPDCVSVWTGSGICSASGDPHYNTFDKHTHHYMGACSYTLTKPCNASSDMFVQHERVDLCQSEALRCSSCFKINPVVLQVNGTVVVPPVTFTSGVQIYLSGKFVVLETSFGLRVRFDGNHHADVSVPSSYSGLLCGLCGKKQCLHSQILILQDDNLKPDNTPAANTNELGESWQVPDPRPE
uniref:VWFD domain-containing protein n=1 Tax=Salarias fasciatus TaxID=181472 RepID=A0A672H0K1_SALFA